MAGYTFVNATELSEFLAGYDIGAPLSFEGISEGVENTNYLLTTSGGKFVLTLFEQRVSVDDLPFYIGFMDHSRQKGIPSPAIIADRRHTKINDLCGKKAVIAGFLLGTAPKTIVLEHLAPLGDMLARLHLAAADFTKPRQNGLWLPEWERLLNASLQKMPGMQAHSFQWVLTELAFLKKNLPQDLPKGSVHADLFPDNVFFDAGKISGVIDFYFACTETFAYDLMLTLNAWCFDKNGGLDLKKSLAFLKAYEALRPLSAAEKQALPLFGRAAALRIVATRLYDALHPRAGAIVTPKDPLEHVKILRYHQSVQSLAGYGYPPEKTP